jgi:hypothetical protein
MKFAFALTHPVLLRSSCVFLLIQIHVGTLHCVFGGPMISSAPATEVKLNFTDLKAISPNLYGIFFEEVNFVSKQAIWVASFGKYAM